MNNNMIKVLAVVVIAGGLYWFMSGDSDPCAAHDKGDACVADTDNGCLWTPDADAEKALAGEGSCAAPKEEPKKEK